MGGNGVPVSSRTKGGPHEGFKRATNALSTLTMQLERQRFSLARVIPAFIVAGLIDLGRLLLLAAQLLPTIPAALHWYEQGTDSLRNGAYYQASKALTQAIQIDDNYALAHARLAQAWTELDYMERAKDELLAATSQTRTAHRYHRQIRCIWTRSCHCDATIW